MLGVRVCACMRLCVCAVAKLWPTTSLNTAYIRGWVRFKNRDDMIAFSTSTNHQLSRRWQHCCFRMAKLPEINSTYIINDVDVVIGYLVELESCDMRALTRENVVDTFVKWLHPNRGHDYTDYTWFILPTYERVNVSCTPDSENSKHSRCYDQNYAVDSLWTVADFNITTDNDCCGLQHQNIL